MNPDCQVCGAKAVIDDLCWKHYEQRFDKKRPCITEGCNNTAFARGMCPKHYQKWRTSPTDYDPSYGLPERPKCDVDGCNELSSSLGLCSNHYVSKRRLEADPDYITFDERKEVYKTLKELIELCGEDGPLKSAEIVGNSLNFILMSGGRERKCNISVKKGKW